MAFVGDSLARNQMQSLVCLLTSVSRPIDISYILEVTDRSFYTDYNFPVAHLWSSHLVKTEGVEVYTKKASNLTLDEVDQTWASIIEDFDYVIISAGPRFLRPLLYYEKGRYVGCHLCDKNQAKDLKMSYVFRMAYRTTFHTLLEREKFEGITILRTATESHVDHYSDKWGEEGDCAWTRPYKKQEMKLDIKLRGASLVTTMTVVPHFHF